MAAATVRTGAAKPSSSPYSSSNGILRARPLALGISKILLMGLSSVVSAAPISVFQQDDDGPGEEGADLWVLYAASIVLVLLGGAFAGLTIAYVLC